VDDFAGRLLAWYDVHGRHDLPWQQEASPYRVWVSEIMLQQTQVSTVVPYYQRFMARFPTVVTLASAPLDDVLHLWSGLGYYARARNLHKAAQQIVSGFDAELPDNLDDMMSLPGIGRSTAGAILALAGGQYQPILDGNVKRVLCRFHEVEGWSGESGTLKTLWRLSEQHTPRERVADYTQAIMDLGATLCTRHRPACTLCPVIGDCGAARSGRQGALPAPRPRRQRPLRRTRCLVLESFCGEVLLQRRPAEGIWGGLWSFPELDDQEVAEQWCERLLGGVAMARRQAEPIRHGFTHFELVLEPVRIALASEPGRPLDNQHYLWYKPAVDKVGVPAPVSAFLQNLSEANRL
jgi:A/G-specific adenine glycosylase